MATPEDDDPLYWVIAEAVQQLGTDADPKAVAERVRRLQVGLPAEDEFSVLLTWLGRCRLVHKLDQLQRPFDSRARWRVPDLLVLFNYRGEEVPVLIEVKTTPFGNDTLSWPKAYRDRITAYANLLNLPLLVAWRYGSFWTLVDVNQLMPAPVRYKISFLEALKTSLMTELAGDFSFSLRPGCGMHLKIRKLERTPEGFRGIIEEAYWMNAKGKRFTNAAGVFPLFICLEQESVLTEDETHVTQSFVIPDAHQAEFASRALGTLLRFTSHRNDVHWRHALERKASAPYAAEGLRTAAQQALDAGFLQYGLNMRPATVPPFLAEIRGRIETDKD